MMSIHDALSGSYYRFWNLKKITDVLLKYAVLTGRFSGEKRSLNYHHGHPQNLTAVLVKAAMSPEHGVRTLWGVLIGMGSDPPRAIGSSL